MTAPPPSEPAAVILSADLLKWIIPKVGRFPRQVRYGLGSRIEAAHLDVLESLVAAQYSRGSRRGEALEFANRRLQVARHLLPDDDDSTTFVSRAPFDRNRRPSGDGARRRGRAKESTVVGRVNGETLLRPNPS